jgi:hypothetical protein
MDNRNPFSSVQADAAATAPPPRSIDPKLAQCIHKAQAEVHAALKTSTNTFHNYQYASADEVVLVARDALEAAGLAWLVIEERIELLEKDAGAWAFLHVTYAMVCVENGAMHSFLTTVPIMPELGKSSGWSRPPDKALFGARTEANGYALRDALLIPRQDAPDVSGRRDGAPRGDGNGGDQRRRPAPERASIPDAVTKIGAATELTAIAAAVQGVRYSWQGALTPEEERPLLVAFADAAVRIIGTYTSPVQVNKARDLLARCKTGDDELEQRIGAALLAAKDRTGRAS